MSENCGISGLSDAGIRALLQREIDKHSSRAAFARANGYSKRYLNYVMSGRRPPTVEMLSALGFEKQRVYVRKNEVDNSVLTLIYR